MINSNLLDFLVNKGVIDLDQRKIIEIETAKKQISYSQCILDLNLVSNNTLAKLIGEFKNEDRNIEDFIIDIKLLKSVPYKFCMSKQCLPISVGEDCLYLGMVKYDINTVEELKNMIKFNKTKIIKADEKQIYELIQKHYAHTDNWIDFIEVSDRSADVFIDRLLLDAISRKSSDIHFSCEESIVKVRYRIDGDLKRICLFHKDYYNRISVKLKLLFSVDITNSVQSRDGSLTKFIFGEKVDFRISFYNCVYGENIVIRILANLNHSTLDKLGYSEPVLKNIRRMIDNYSGMVIFIGPTGSGKTTSLYSALREIDHNKFNIMTVEDPVECNLKGVQQSDINFHPDLSFASCLRSILRQDPDVILIGEIRDSETANIALRAAMTGHKVYTTMHAKNIFAVLDRMEELGVSKRMAAHNICGIVAQRLVKKNCEVCKNAGCSTCNQTGYKGRCVIAESLFLDDEVIEILMSDERLDIKRQKLASKGYTSILDDGMLKVEEGIISAKQLIAHTDGA